MIESSNEKKSNFDLESRTTNFARQVRIFVRQIPRTISNIEDGKQLIRSSGSVGANYIEANEAFSRKDFAFRLKISRKEIKESVYWLQLIDVHDIIKLEESRSYLAQEAKELLYIFSAILNKL